MAMATDMRTKCKCIKCHSQACNRCTTFEDDEEAVGWQMGVAVGYCIDCQLDYVNDTTKICGERSIDSPTIETFREDRECLTPSTLLETNR